LLPGTCSRTSVKRQGPDRAASSVEGRGRRTARERRPRCPGETRWRRKPRRGAEPRRLHRRRGHRTPAKEQRPEVGAHVAGLWETAEATGVNRHEGKGPGNRARLLREGQTPEGREPWTWQRGETNPQFQWRRKPSRACETPRTDRSGDLGGRRVLWTPLEHVATRAQTPGEALRAGPWMVARLFMGSRGRSWFVVL